MKYLIVFICFEVLVPAQQANRISSWLSVHDTTQGVLVGNNTLPGPHQLQLPYAPGFLLFTTQGFQGQPCAVYGTQQVPLPGLIPTPSGMIDIEYWSAAPVWQAVLGGGACSPCTVPANISTQVVPIPHGPAGSFSLSLQAVFGDPTSPNGYSLSSALWIFRP